METIRSGSWERIRRISPRRPNAVSSRLASQRVGAKFMNSRYWKSNSHGTQRNMNAEFSRSTLVSTGPIAGSPLTIETWASGSSSVNSRATARAGRSWPSPMSAEMIRTWRGRDSASGSPAGITAGVLALGGLRAFCSRRQSTYLRTPSENGVAAVQPSSCSARLLHTIFPPKSPGRAGV